MADNKWHKGSRFYQMALLFGLGAFVLAWQFADVSVFTAVGTAALGGMGGMNMVERYRSRRRNGGGPEGE